MISMSLYIYLSYGLYHEVTIGGMDTHPWDHLPICDRADEHLYMSVESLVSCEGRETWRKVPWIQYICCRETLKI